MWRWALIVVLIFAGQAVWGQGGYPVTSPSLGAGAGPDFGPASPGPSPSVSPYDAAWPPPSGRPSYTAQTQQSLSPVGSMPVAHAEREEYHGFAPPGGTARDARLYDGTPMATAPTDRSVPLAISPTAPLGERCTESTWYYRLETFHWNERVDGIDFVNEYGPISTLGYQRRHGVERFRVELFGGTVAYDGAAQLEDGSLDPYHQSFGTNYLGCRGEYELLVDPWQSSCIRFFVGLGTRFWIRDLRDAVTPDGVEVDGYQETWWTFYPYIGLETKEPTEPGLHFFCSGRIGATPLTYQHATYFDTTVYPRCGLTGNLELGVRYSGFLLSAYTEAMTWAASAMVRDSFQPASSMVTFGGRMAYSF